MFIVGYATAEEIDALEERGYEIEAADKFGCVAPYTAEENGFEAQGFFVRGEGYLMTKPEPGPSGTQAVAIFIDAAVYDMLKEDLFTKEQLPALAAQYAIESETPALNSLSVSQWTARKMRLINHGNALREEANNFKYCSHKYTDGSDARYSTGNGEKTCVCGNKWD